MNMVGDLRLLELNEELVLLKNSKVVEVDFLFVDGQLKAKGTMRRNRTQTEFNELIDIDQIEEMTVKEFHDYLIKK